MRFSTGKYVVEKKLAIGQTLYESKIRPKSSCITCQLIHTPVARLYSTHVSKVLHNQRNSLVLQKTH
jgi:hypothetical protein